MSRSGYIDDCDIDSQWATICWRGAVNSAIKGKRGQAFLKEMAASMDALSEKKLVSSELEVEGSVCAIGSVGKSRGVDMRKIDPEDSSTVASTFGIAESMVREIVYMNDECGPWKETEEARFQRMRKWVESQIK